MGRENSEVKVLPEFRKIRSLSKKSSQRNWGLMSRHIRTDDLFVVEHREAVISKKTGRALFRSSPSPQIVTLSLPGMRYRCTRLLDLRIWDFNYDAVGRSEFLSAFGKQMSSYVCCRGSNLPITLGASRYGQLI